MQRLRRSREKMPNYREVLELAEKILQEKHRVKTQWSFPPVVLDPIKARIQMQEGFPYLRPDEIPLDPIQTQEYFFRLLGVLKEQNPKRHEDLRKTIEARGFVFDGYLKHLLGNRVTEMSLEEELGKEGSLLFFFIVQSLKPALEVQAASWQRQQKEGSWSYGYCPFCGGLPGIGEIQGEEGKRALHCPFCATEWNYPRMKCPYCENEDQEKLTYFQVEGEVGYRVDICLNCQHYLKTVDSRERNGSLDWEVEDYLTLHLDHLAQEEGYTRPERLFVEAH